jgi:predicted SAM-dependent methyltransferase
MPNRGWLREQCLIGLLKSFVRRRFTLGVYEALRSVRMELAFNSRHRRGVDVARRYRESQDLQLHLGCGPNHKPGWINIDLIDSTADLSLDLREPLPFAEQTVRHVYSEHAFEHLTYPVEANRLLAECMRVLKAGGIFDVGVPDTERAIYDYYVERDPEKLALARKLWHREPWLDLPLHQLNYHFYQGTEHKYAWDYETLSRVLEKAGYVGAHRRPFDPQLDDERRRGSLYIRAYKPPRPP